MSPGTSRYTLCLGVSAALRGAIRVLRKMSVSPPPPPTVRMAFLTGIALIFLALILRSPLTAIAPVVSDLRQGLGVSSATIGLMTSIPVLCFGLLTPLASLIIARTSVEMSIFLTLAGALCGLVLRSCGGIALTLCGTVILGAALTIGNIVSLMVIARDFPQQNRMLTGIYTSALNVGTMLTTAITAPLAVWLGWRIALASSALFILPALALWVMVITHCHTTPVVKAPRYKIRNAPESLWQRPLVWLLIVAFATHLTVYYSLTAWLPDYFIQATGMRATTAGIIAAVFQILALLGSFGAPLLASRLQGAWLLAIVAMCWIVTPLGFWLVPQGFILWSILGGIASGGGFTVIFMLIMNHAHDLQDNRRISAAVQGGGYTLSAMGPIVVGHLHQATASWAPGFLLLAGAAFIMLLSGLVLAHKVNDRH